MTDKKQDKAQRSAHDARQAAENILDALARGQEPRLEDAKVLEAAGCYIRRAIA